MNKSGVWKSVEGKSEGQREKTSTVSSKDGSPDGGIVISVEKVSDDLGNEEERRCLVSDSEKKND